MTTYLHREVTCSISTCLVQPELNMEARLKVGDTETPEMLIRRVLELSQSNFPAAARAIAWPNQPCPGDQPLLQVSLKFVQLPDDENMDTLCVEVMATETVLGDGAVAAMQRVGYRIERKLIGAVNRILKEAA